MVADSALYSENNLKLMENIKWISRVPLTLKKAKNLVKGLTNIEFKKSEPKGYTYQEELVTYGGIEQGTFNCRLFHVYDRWNFNFFKQGLDYVVTPPDWVQVIPANQTSQASIGFCANKLGSDYKPTQVSATSL